MPTGRPGDNDARAVPGPPVAAQLPSRRPCILDRVCREVNRASHGIAANVRGTMQRETFLLPWLPGSEPEGDPRGARPRCLGRLRRWPGDEVPAEVEEDVILSRLLALNGERSHL